MEERIQRLLDAIWGQREGYVFLPYKQQPNAWHETTGVPYAGKLPDLDSLPHRVDQYFCPVVFSEPLRQKKFALPTNVLWADLDPADPNKCRLKPSIAWESSPGRYQAIWFLTSEVEPDTAAALSKRIAYADGGDKGGWDLTQVLRLPGTQNFKYAAAPEVRLLWAKSRAYAVEEIRGAYPAVNGETHDTEVPQWSEMDEPIVQAAIAALPTGFKKRLMQDTAGADRSMELQKLTRDLVRFGLSPDVVVHVIQRSTWNKFLGRNDEHQQLLKQVASAQAAVGRKSKKPAAQDELKIEEVTAMQVRTWGDFLRVPTNLRWLVDEAWVDGSVGFISGRSKSYKTWIALDLALSIVSGSPFLGRYPVRRTGPVLLIQEEDPASVLQERLRLIGKSKGMLPKLLKATSESISVEYPDYPLHIINLQGFNLGAEEKVAQVRNLIAQINPVMVILDPFIVLLPQGVDEFKGGQISAVLQSVKMWREEFGCSVVIVHHWNKGKNEEGDRFAEHMYGSFAFHAWLESAIHVMPIIPEEDSEQQQIKQVLVEREFKAAVSGRAQRITFNIDTTKNYTYSVEFDDNTKVGPKEQAILDFVSQAGPSTTMEIVAATGMRRPDFVEVAGRVVRAKLLMARKGGGRGNPTVYWLPDQDPPD
jgi:hypothetical protein